ncbi:MAG: CDP-alcohol phosphatidyltransferase family protein [Aquificaceae bacterium]
MLSSLINIPNLISLFRLLASPLLLFVDSRFLPYLFMLLALTDALDGFVARKLKVRTELGMVLDPLADKALLLVGLYICTFKLYSIPKVLFLTLLMRDGFLLIGGLLFLKKKGKVPSPSLYGKLTTFSLSTTALYAMVFQKGNVLFLAFFLSQTLVIISWIDYSVRGIYALKSNTCKKDLEST